MQTSTASTIKVKEEETGTTLITTDEGVKTGRVIWYNPQKAFGFIIGHPAGTIFRVGEAEIIAKGKPILQGGTTVEFKPKEDERNYPIACEVTGPDRKPIVFEEGNKAQKTQDGPRYIIFAPGSDQNPNMPAAGPGGRLPPPEINPDVVVKGTVTKWNNKLCFGFIQPDGPFSPVFVHQSAIESDGFRGLKVGGRVEFRVGTTEHSKGKPTAIKVTGPDGVAMTYYPPHVYKKMMRDKRKADGQPDESRKFELVNDEIHKGTMKWFSFKKCYGFIQPDGKEDSEENHIFVHMSETRYMPPKVGSAVEFKLGKNKDGKFVAVSVTGKDGGPLQFGNKRKSSALSKTEDATSDTNGQVSPKTEDIVMQASASTVNGNGSSLPTPASSTPVLVNATDNDVVMLDSVTPGASDTVAAVSVDSTDMSQSTNGSRTSKGKQTGKKRKNGSQNEVFKCDICKKEIVGQHQYDSHINGKAHKHKAEMVGMETECKLCDVTFSGKAHRESHVSGRRHQQNLNPSAFSPMKRRRYPYPYEASWHRFPPPPPPFIAPAYGTGSTTSIQMQ